MSSWTHDNFKYLELDNELNQISHNQSMIIDQIRYMLTKTMKKKKVLMDKTQNIINDI